MTMTAMLSMGFIACGSGDDDEDTGPNNPNEQNNPERPFHVEFYNFQNGLGATIRNISSGLEAESTGEACRYRVTNADATVYKSIEYEEYPSTGQAAQGIKEITVVLADNYPATVEQIVGYYQYLNMFSSENGIWKFCDSEEPNKANFEIVYTAAARKLVYTLLNEPLFLDFSSYLGKDIQSVGWGKVDDTGNYLTYEPRGLRDGMVWSVNMFADWAYNKAGQRQEWKAVNLIIVEFVKGWDRETLTKVFDYLNRTYIYVGSESVGNYPNTKSLTYYYNKDKTMNIAFMSERKSTDLEDIVYSISYEPYKKINL